MANHVELDLKAFQVSSKIHDLSLSVISRAFIHSSQATNITRGNLSSPIQSKNLWLLPRGLCRLDISLRPSKYDVRGGDRDKFIDLVVDAVCQSSAWAQLGLIVRILHVSYDQQEGNGPSIYLGIEQPDMSSALISPPHTLTAHLCGVECILQFESSTGLKRNWDFTLYPERSDELLTNHHANSNEPWKYSAELVEAAFAITLGTRNSIRGLMVREPIKSPTLLDLAPAIYNSHYRKTIVSHAINFAIIENIFATSLNGQSPKLRRKGAELLEDDSAHVNNDSTQQSASRVGTPIQCMLWDLLRKTVKSTVGMSNVKAKKRPPPETESLHQGVEIGQISNYHSESDLSNATPDQPMPDYIYDRTNDIHGYEVPAFMYDEDDGVYGYNHGGAVPERRGINDYHLTGITPTVWSFWADPVLGETEEGSHS